jgi:hypothetical protein
MSEKHRVLYLEELTRNEVLRNFKSCSYLVPMDRCLMNPLGDYYKPSAVLSGLYGDVVFADNDSLSINYSSYYKSEGFSSHDYDDQQIMEAYNCLPRLSKLHRIALRAQKLTRQSFSISPGFDFVVPFVDPQVVIMASNIENSGLYQSLVRRHMHPKLRGFIHQSTLSYYTHPSWLRFAERKLFNLFQHPFRKPYFDNEYLDQIGILRNEVPALIK